jgi:glycosyltransferase involved in cell wall biosynthesis
MELASPQSGKKQRRVRLAYLVSHPIQYQAPLLRRIAREPDIDFKVFFGSDFSVRGYEDRGFGGVNVKWDVPLLDGYDHEFLPVIRDDGSTGPLKPLNYGIGRRLIGRDGSPAFDALWVHGYSTANALHAILAAKGLGIPVLLRAESWLGDRERTDARKATKKLFLRTLGWMIDGVLPIGSLNAAYWRHYLGEGVPQFLMPYAVDNEYFQQRSSQAAAQREELRAELKLEPGRPVILFASKLTARKRASDLLKAYRLLSPSPGLEPRPYLIIVGDGEEKTALEEEARSTGFTSICFCGFRNQSELPRFFDLATVFVLPSRHEPWGLIVNEAMNAARAVIVSNEVGCQPDLVTDGREGAVFPAGDIAALSDVLKRILSDSGTAVEMGQRALERIKYWNFEEDIRGLRSALATVTGKVEP